MAYQHYATTTATTPNPIQPPQPYSTAQFPTAQSLQCNPAPQHYATTIAIQHYAPYSIPIPSMPQFPTAQSLQCNPAPQHYATTTATNPMPPPPPYSIHVQASVPFPSTPQHSSQTQFHFPTATRSQSLQYNPAPPQRAWLGNPYPGNQGQPPQSNPALRGYTRTRHGCPPPQHTVPSLGMPHHPLLHPPVTGIQGSTVPPVLRAAFVPSITPKEERKIEVYVGSLATTVEDDFILSLLELCGPVKDWKRSEDPTTGTPNRYGFCEFESVVGVLRALRLLSKLNVDGQELKIRVTADERKYLEDFVEKTKSSKKLKGSEGQGAKKDEETNDTDVANFGIVTDEDREADQKALERLTGMIEERLKNSPVLPPPSLLPAHASGLREEPARSRDGDSDVDMTRNVEDKDDDEMTRDSKPTSEHDEPETSSTDRSRGQERSKKGGKREKEKQLERYEIERMQDMYEARANRRRKLQKNEWECRERQKEYLRRLEKERNKEKEYKRKWEIREQEDDIDGGNLKRTEHKSSEERRRLEKKVSEYTQRRKYLQKLKKEEKKGEKYRRKPEGMKQEDDIDGGDFGGDLKRRKHKSSSSKERRRKLREKEEDSEDRLKEEKVAEKSDAGKARSTHSHDRSSRRVRGQNDNETNRTRDEGRKDNYARSGVREQGSHKDKPLDKQKLFDAKRISSVSQEEKSDVGKDRSKRSHDRSSPRVTGRNDDETNRGRDEGIKDNYARSGVREQGFDKAKTPDNQKLLNLIDLIPTAKDEVFSYKINWAVYDKNKLYDQMRLQISTMIEKFLGKKDTPLEELIVSSMRKHVEASEMLKRIQSILGVEVEMFVVTIWRLLILEIMKIETRDLSKT